MAQTTQLIVQQNNVDVVNQVLNSDQLSTVNAKKGMKITLVDAKTGQPAKTLKAKKQADDLIIANENGDALLTIEDYYLVDDVQIGTVSDTGFIEFDYVNSEAGASTQVISETSYTTLTSQMLSDASIVNGISNGILFGTVGAAALGVAAISSGSSDDSPKAPANKLPVSEDSEINATEDTVATGQLNAATDVDGDALTYALKSEATNGKVTVNADGSYSYTPNANFNGEDSFSYTINDGQGGVITQTATITVAAVNDVPVSEGSTIAANEDTVATGKLAVATDVDGDSLTYVLKDTATNGSVTVNADGSYSYTPNANFNGSDSFTYTIDDGQGGVITQTATITVATVNDAPVSTDSTIAATEDMVVKGSLSKATDVDGDTLTYAIVTNAANGKVTISKDGSYSYTPNANFHGEDSFTYTVTDGAETITKTATVTVASINDLPISKDSTITATEDTIATGKLEAATDADGDALTYALKSEAANGSVTVNADGSYSYMPNANFNGNDSFTYTVTDGTETITKNANVTVASVNDLPVSTGTAITAIEDTMAEGKLAQATDADGDSLTYAIATNTANGKVVIGKDGSYSYTPNANFNGEDSFTYTINDGQGGVITKTATITVAAVNDAPVSGDSVIAATEDTVATGQLAVATDVDGDTLTYALDTEATNGSVTVNADGSYSYTPNANFNGEDSFTYTVTDGTEAITKTATVTVASVNDAPVSEDSVIAATEDTVATGQLNAATDVDGDALTYALKENAANGSVTINADGSYSYTPNANFNGEDSFTYTINDGQGGVITQTATITVAAVNDAPVSEDSFIGVAQNRIDSGKLTEATDADGDTLTYALSAEAANGKVTVNADGGYRYTPNTDFIGDDSFSYTVSDGNGESITKTANVTVSTLDKQTDFELQEAFETVVASEPQTVIDKQASSYIYDTIEFEITGNNAAPELIVSNSSNIIQASYSYTLQGSSIYASSSGSINSAGSSSKTIDLEIDTLPPGQYILDLYVDSFDSDIHFNITEFKDVERTEFTGYQDISGNIFADDNGNINAPDNYDIQVAGQSMSVQAGIPSEGGLTVDTKNGQLTIKPNGDYSYQSDRNSLGLDPSKLTEDFYVKVIDVDTKQAMHYEISVTADTTPPESGELVFNNFEDTGLSQDDGVSQDNSFDLTVQGNEAGSQVEYQYSTDQGATWQVLANGAVSNLSDGDYSFRAKVTDEALNESFTAVKDITIDTTAPILGDVLNFNVATNQLEVNADIDQDTLQAFKLENGAPTPIADANNIPFADGSYQIQASDVAGNNTSLDFVMSTASEYFESADIIDVVKGSAGDDYIYGGNGDDILISSGGNDSLYGEAGNDTLIYGGNSSGYIGLRGREGDDTYIVDVRDFVNNPTITIQDYRGSNKLELKGVNQSDITLTRNDTSLEISTADGKIDLYNQFATGSSFAGVDNIYFDDGTVWDKATIDALTGGKITGTDGDDVLALDSDSSVLYGGDGNDTLTGGVNNDYIYGGNGDDILISSGGNDSLYGEAGNDTLIYGGNSSGYIGLRGREGDDTYIVDVRDFVNNPTITIQDYRGSNKLELKGVDQSDITLTRNDTSLEISTADGKIDLYNQFVTDSSFAGVDNIYFDDGTVWDRATIEAMVDDSAPSVMSFAMDNTAFDFANIESDAQAGSLTDSTTALLSIDDLLDINQSELMFESAETAPITDSSSSVAANDVFDAPIAADFSFDQGSMVNDNLQDTAMFHII